MKEKNFQTEFTKWAKYRFKGSGVFELKICKEKSMPFGVVQEHQINALKLSKHDSVVYKIPDGSYDQKPFDCFRVEKVSAYVVVIFYRRGQKEFFMIDIDDFIKEKETSDRKSLTEDRARELGIACLLE